MDMTPSDSILWMTVFGFFVERRTFLFLSARYRWAVIPHHSTALIVYVGISILALEMDILKSNLGLLVQFTTLSVLLARYYLILERQKDQLCQGFQSWLENLILRLRMGESFRSAFGVSASKCFDPQLRMILSRQEIGFQLSQTGDVRASMSPPFFHEVFLRLQDIDRTPHRVQGRLEMLLQLWRQQVGFRRKSRQASRQYVVQMVFLGVMYLGLLGWGAHRYPAERFWPSVRMSLLFILGGIVALLFFRRRKRWRI